MRLISIEASGLVAAAALTEDGRLVAEYRVDNKKTHSQTLLPMVAELIEMAGITMKDIDTIAVSAGPGSFTGLRIGAATAKGLAFADDKPIVPVTTTDAMAWQLYGEEGVICPIMDARRGQVYTGLYSFKERADGSEPDISDMEVLKPVCAIDVTELVKEINRIADKAVFLGDGVPVYRDRIKETIRVPYRFSPPWKNRQSAAALADIAGRYFAAGKSVSADTFAPMYLRQSQAERESGAALGAIRIREMTASDAREAALLEAETLGREAWTESMLREAADRRDSIYLAAFLGERQVGHAGIKAVCGEGELTNVCVAPDSRRNGVASALVKGLVKRSGELGIGDITLEVRSGNAAAVALYKKSGFNEEGVRKAFYEAPVDDAVIMWLRR